MTPLAWVCAAFGIVVGVITIVAVVYDVCAVVCGHETISRWCLTAAQSNPVFPAMVSGVLCLVAGMLLGHLFFPQQP